MKYEIVEYNGYLKEIYLVEGYTHIDALGRYIHEMAGLITPFKSYCVMEFYEEGTIGIQINQKFIDYTNTNIQKRNGQYIIVESEVGKQDANSDKLQTEENLQNQYSNRSRKASWIITLATALFMFAMFLFMLHHYRELAIDLQDCRNKLHQCIINTENHG